MSADFWAGYISGAVSIIIGNPLDVLKVRLQAGNTPSPSSSPHAATPISTRPPIPGITPTIPSPTTPTTTTASYLRPFLLGTAAPVLGYGALNALLFVSYNRTEAFLNQHLFPPPFSGGVGNGNGRAAGDSDQGRGTNLTTTWLAGAVGGLATWVVSTPTELVKCRAQLEIPAGAGGGAAGGRRAAAAGTSASSSSSLAIARSILRTSGLRGLYFGGGVTALRDSIGYGFYFWGYELCSRWMHQLFPPPSSSQAQQGGGGGVLGTDAARVLLCGGMAGVITWASVFPLDVIKTRVQTQVLDGMGERAALLGGGGGLTGSKRRRLGAWDVAKETYREGGVRPFFRGLVVCSVRAFIVNAVQWAVYEWIMMELGQGRRRQEEGEVGVVSG